MTEKFLSAQGIIYVNTRKNNTHVSLCNFQGQTIIKSSAGLLGLKGRRRGRALAGQRVIEYVVDQAKTLGFYRVELHLKGFGRRRNLRYRILLQRGIEVVNLVYKNTLPHNGCRPPKKRRL